MKVCVANRNIGQILFTALFLFSFFIFPNTLPAVRISLLTLARFLLRTELSNFKLA